MKHEEMSVRDASVTGSRHRVNGAPNQDAAYFAGREGRFVAVVCDGCGSAPASGVGAYLGARLVAECALAAEGDPLEAGFWTALTEAASARLMAIAEQTTRAPAALLEEAALFTIVGVLFSGAHAIFFALGDGVIGCNDCAFVIGPFADNAPPYLAYRLLDGRDLTIAPVLVRDAAAVERFFVATDGAAELLAEGASPAWPAVLAADEARFFDHPDALRRKLAQLTRPPSVLADDTTIILGKRGGGA